jgi:hypothetical protein
VDGHDRVVAESGIGSTDLAFVALDKEPVINAAARVGEIESHENSTLWKEIASEVRATPRPQDIVRLGMLVREVRPLLGPSPKRAEYRLEVSAGGGELVIRTVPVGLWLDGDDTCPFKVAKPLREQRARQPGRATGDLIERPTSE